jgi:flagellar basal-body rod modification protein FlgD
MPVSNISDSFASVLQGDSSQGTKKEDPLGRDAFLKMLLAQMEHQDPLNPMDGADFSAQLAQFSSLEQLFQMNDSLDTLNTTLEPNGNENVLDYIGKEILSEDDTLRLINGEVAGGSFSLEEAGDIVVAVYDDIGREVITLYPGQLDAGTHEIDWNGYDRTGQAMPDGMYRFEIAAVDEGGIYTPIKAATSGTVTGVSWESGVPFLEVDGRRVDPATVIKVWTAG